LLAIAQVVGFAEKDTHARQTVNHFPQLRRQLFVIHRVRIGQLYACVGQPLKVADQRHVFEVHHALPELLALVGREHV